jgi:hypothetical protein
LEHAARFLIGLGCRFQVLAPPELLQTLRDLASDLTAIVETSTQRMAPRLATGATG